MRTGLDLKLTLCAPAEGANRHNDINAIAETTSALQELIMKLETLLRAEHTPFVGRGLGFVISLRI